MTKFHLSYRQLLNKAWPIMLANIAMPLLGLVDTAIIGHWGSKNELAALAVGTIALNFVFWNFGFLRMSTTGFIAQATGNRNTIFLVQTIIRATTIALVIAALLLAAKGMIVSVILSILAPPPEAIEGASTYLYIRLWAAPATLFNFVIAGLLIGQARTTALLALQIILNLLNAIFDIVCVGIFELGISGIAWGTLLAEYLTAIIGFFWLVSKWLPPIPTTEFKNNLWQKSSLLALVKSNRDIWIRTLFLLFAFLGFTHFSGQFGATSLAANHILLQVISLSAFFLDGYAHVTEAYVGQAIGQKSKAHFMITIRRTSYLATVTALLLALVLFMSGSFIIAALTDLIEVQTAALQYLPYVAIYIALSAAAFQLDGIFIGANESAAMRNSSILTTIIYFGSWYLGFSVLGMTGIWLGFILMVILRSIFLTAALPRLFQRHFAPKNI